MMGLNMINVIMSNEGLAGSNMESVTIERLLIYHLSNMKFPHLCIVIY